MRTPPSDLLILRADESSRRRVVAVRRNNAGCAGRNREFAALSGRNPAQNRPGGAANQRFRPAQPHSMETVTAVARDLYRAVEDADYRPDTRRWERTMALLESVTANAPDGYVAQPMPAGMYLMWMASCSTAADGGESERRCSCSRAAS